MDINRVINSPNEQITDVQPNELMDHVVELHAPDDKEEEEANERQPVSHKEAI